LGNAGADISAVLGKQGSAILYVSNNCKQQGIEALEGLSMAQGCCVSLTKLFSGDEPSQLPRETRHGWLHTAATKSSSSFELNAYGVLDTQFRIKQGRSFNIIVNESCEIAPAKSQTQACWVRTFGRSSVSLRQNAVLVIVSLLHGHGLEVLICHSSHQ
jgi:hypothetical protein